MKNQIRFHYNVQQSELAENSHTHGGQNTLYEVRAQYAGLLRSTRYPLSIDCSSPAQASDRWTGCIVALRLSMRLISSGATTCMGVPAMYWGVHFSPNKFDDLFENANAIFDDTF